MQNKSATKRGGKRQGAGRKSGTGTYGETTKAIRVPESWVPTIKTLLNQRKRQFKQLARTSATSFVTASESGKLASPHKAIASIPDHIKIQAAIDNFLSLVIGYDNELEDLGILISSLEELVYSVRFAGDSFDETEFPDPPETGYSAIRKAVKKRFPTLNWYNMATHISEQTEKTELFMRDAVDDLVDIVIDLQKVTWRFENTSKNDALWHFHWGYMNTWGRTLRFLQLYLHDFWW